MVLDAIPPFLPHRLLRGGHAQTLVGNFLTGSRVAYRAVAHKVSLADGDAIVLHDDKPACWSAGGPTALLLHGLAGCHESGYMIRVADKLNGVGVRTFRMDLRSCGAGNKLARLPYHAGRSEDALAALEFIDGLCSDSPISLVGFSLGGNIVLKLLGENPQCLPASLIRGMAVNPSLDLSSCIAWISRPSVRLYDRHFVRLLYRQLKESSVLSPNGSPNHFSRPPRRILEFDDQFTAPVCGFGTAENYYARCSAAQFVKDISVPTLIISARDDPLVPPSIFEALTLPKSVSLYLTDHGGHLGYIGRKGVDADRRWMDWRVVDWLTKFNGVTRAT